KLGYDATPFNQILKQNAKREMRLRLGKVTVADVLAAQPVTTNLLKFMRASIKMIGVSNLQSFIASSHLARKLSLRRKRSSPNVFEMAATETITSIILIKLIRVSLGTVRHPRRFKIVVIDIQITLKQMLRDFIGIRVNRAK